MSKTIVLLDHPVGKRDDRASQRIEQRGYAVEWCCPGEERPAPEIRDDHAGVVVYGGPESVNDLQRWPYLREELDWIEDWLAAGKPYFGICLGAQLLATALGAGVSRHPGGHHEIGYVEIAPTPAANGFMDGPMHVYHWHNEGFDVPDCADLLATGPVFGNQAFRAGAKTYGIQFHPEVTPEVFGRWIEEAGHMLDEPGAHSKERQLADSKLHDAAMSAWLDSFLDHWLE